MALNNTDLTTLSNSIITRHQLSGFPDILNSVKEIVEICDLELEEKFPSVYVGALTGSTVSEKKFINARYLYCCCRVFALKPDYWLHYSKLQSTIEVQNSAQTRVKFSDNKNIGQNLNASNYCMEYVLVMVDLGVIKPEDFNSTNLTCSYNFSSFNRLNNS